MLKEMRQPRNKNDITADVPILIGNDSVRVKDLRSM